MRKLFLILAGMAVMAAANAGKPHAAVSIQPQSARVTPPGQASDIVVTLTPSSAMDTLQLVFRGEAGLTVQAGQSQIFSAPGVGVPITHRVTVLGAHEGLFHLTAVATAQSGGHSTSRIVSIEVLVGDPARVQKARVSPATQMDSTGQRIRSMPAQERPPQSR